MSIGDVLNPAPTTLLQGTLDLLILKSLVAGEMHGLGISRRIQQITFFAVGAILAAAGFMACFIPAYRATKVDPMIALRYE
jgi:ABC-type lipoprotein release transport system permease subunit